MANNEKNKAAHKQLRQFPRKMPQPFAGLMFADRNERDGVSNPVAYVLRLARWQRRRNVTGGLAKPTRRVGESFTEIT